jgi:hypothetical protein
LDFLNQNLELLLVDLNNFFKNIHVEITWKLSGILLIVIHLWFIASRIALTIHVLASHKLVHRVIAEVIHYNISLAQRAVIRNLSCSELRPKIMHRAL